MAIISITYLITGATVREALIDFGGTLASTVRVTCRGGGEARKCLGTSLMPGNRRLHEHRRSALRHPPILKARCTRRLHEKFEPTAGSGPAMEAHAICGPSSVLTGASLTVGVRFGG